MFSIPAGDTWNTTVGLGHYLEQVFFACKRTVDPVQNMHSFAYELLLEPHLSRYIKESRMNCSDSMNCGDNMMNYSETQQGVSALPLATYGGGLLL